MDGRMMVIEIKFPEKVIIPKGGFLRLEEEPLGPNESVMTAIVTDSNRIEAQRFSWAMKISSCLTIEEQGRENP